MTRHLVRIGDLDAEALRRMLARAAAMAGEGAPGLLRDRIVCTAFFEPSTRTRLSFEAAAHRLGADVIGFADAQSTSTRKGESLEDTARVLSGYADLVVLRHFEQGAPARAAAVSGVPVVNAGDGSGEHPTQTLVDLYTMQRHHGELTGLKVAVIGDLRHGRTVHSLVPALRTMGAEVVAVPVGGLELPKPLGPVPRMDLEGAAADCDVLYVTRVQRERLPGRASVAEYRVDADLLERTGSRAIVLHPLPRVDELGTDLDGTPAAKYFEQAQNGVPVRMAVLASLLENA